MAVCRWGDGDLYIYEDLQGQLVCCACKLLTQPGPKRDGVSFACSTPEEMIIHVEEHQAAGHDVQKHVIETLRKEAQPTRKDSDGPNSN
jgi:hypothetical protein